MAIHVAIWNKGDVHKFGRGEDRWNTNLVEFLQKENYWVSQCLPNLRVKCSVYLDAPDECEYLAGKPHVHLKFNACGDSYKELPCYKNGELILGTPYRISYNDALKHWNGNNNLKIVFLPLPFCDHRLPVDLIRSFDRKEISWANKEAFGSHFKNNQPAVYRNSLYSLRALNKFAKKVDFTFNVMMSQDIVGEEPLALLEGIANRRELRIQPWLDVICHMGRSKVSIHAGGIAGSILESMFCKALPIQNEGAFFNPRREINLLPWAEEATEDDWYNALETYWFDEDAHNKLSDFYQEIFIEHRSDGARKAIKEAFEIIGVR